MKILVVGATGLIGRSLCGALASNHEVIVVGRKLAEKPKGVDAVVNLAGRPISSRWTKRAKEEILRSRVETTQSLVRDFANVRVFINASAVGFYGDRGDTVLNESSTPGQGFLANVCKAWEDALVPLACRKVALRTGMVLSREGGALVPLLRLFGLGLGGRMGSGQQWVSWIVLADAVRAIEHILKTETVSGPVNLTAPNPVRQEGFAQVLAKALNRPCFTHAPAWALRLGMGEMSHLVLESQRAAPQKLLESGFKFEYSDLELALRAAIDPHSPK